MHYIIGLVVALIGVLLVIKSEWFFENFGSISWAEEHLGTSGGSRLMYKLIGLAFIFIGFLVITNLFGGFLEGTVGRFLIPS